MISNRYLAAMTCLIILMASCGQHRYFALDEYEIVPRFPQVIRVDVNNEERVRTGAMGVLGIKIIKDYIILSTQDEEGCLSVYEKKGGLYINSFLKTGRGPGEILYYPYISWLTFSDNHGMSTVGIYDFQGRYWVYDILSSAQSGHPVGTLLRDSLSTTLGARYFQLDSTRLLCRKGTEEQNGFERYILEDNGMISFNKSITRLNGFTSSNPNLLSTIMLINHNRGIIAECGSGLPSIHLYSSESNDSGMTILLGDDPMDLTTAESTPEEERVRNYYDAKPYENGFAALYLGTTHDQLDSRSFPLPEIHIFSWKGEPLAKVLSPIRTLCFDIDWEECVLYLIDVETEDIVKYPIPKVLKNN